MKQGIVSAPPEPTFRPLPLGRPFSLDLGGPHPTSVASWHDSALRPPANGTHFAYAIAGTSVVRVAGADYPLLPGMYAAFVDGELHGSGAGLMVTRLGVFGMFQLGGPIEATGRLSYIDGCSDTLLIGPPRLGDPCLNHLHIPAGTRQTQHTHPSLRVGVIVRGTGRCIAAEQEHPLEPGLAFVISSGARHSFVTDHDSLDVVVYHPDTDTGPSNEDHPMINRTIVARD
jgi:quercetin dioxygenase-like cupin family protein